jgi:hypothetical protein
MRFSMRICVGVFLPVVAFAVYYGPGSVGDDVPGAAAVAVAPAAPVAPAPHSNGAPILFVDASQAARVGIRYEIQPKVSDPDNDRLTFSAENLPPWASINEVSGKIIGTPRTSDIGEHADIVITVADAGHRVATKAFSINVIGAGEGVARLQWRRPFSKVDGSNLDDLAGYRIAYGRDPEELDHSVFITDPSQTSFEFATLDSGVWYFAVIAVNVNGLEGPPTVARKVI